MTVEVQGSNEEDVYNIMSIEHVTKEEVKEIKENYVNSPRVGNSGVEFEMNIGSRG